MYSIKKYCGRKKSEISQFLNTCMGLMVLTMIWFIHHVSNNYKTSTSTASFIRRPVERREGNWNFNLITILIIWSADPSWGVNLWLWGCRGWNTWTMIPAQWTSCTQRFRQGSRQRGQAHSQKFHYIRYIIFHGCKLISNSFCLFLIGFKYLLID